ncbi:MAG: hypothetical protein ACTTH5_00705 [Wolinella sp.]
MERGLSTLEVSYNRAVSESLKVPQSREILKERAFRELRMQEAFTQYVYGRIKARNPSRKVLLSGAYIVICGECNEESLYILPLWRSVNEPLVELSSEINCALREIAKGRKHNIYLAYPRLGNQVKHVIIKSSALERSKKSYSLKLVPYVCDLACLLNNKQGGIQK